jgi:DNA gyrase subunit A
MSDLPDEPSELTSESGDGDGTESVQVIEIQEEMEQSFLDYAMSVIVSRALPDARDGLKPVHRRILWSMYSQGFRPDRSHVKCARTTGHVVANYHPHGEGAVYDALVRMAQPFSLRDPLIDFHGNYGSPEYDAAAQRYTEARLARLAMKMLEGIDEETVDLHPNYAGNEEEPVVLPARFPNLLVNGSQGIAVGMATSIPSHNLGEVIDATIHLIDNPDADVAALLNFIKGPDFPTGAQILGRRGYQEAYLTGRGSVKLRADAEIEENAQGRTIIVVSSLPYQKSPGGIAGRIAELVNAREIEGIADVNDESSGEDTRLVIELKRDANANVVLNNLYKHTDLQTSFPINMVALVDGVPRTLNLVQLLQAYIGHQVDVITRRSEFRLKDRQRRAHLLEGRLRALDAIDAIIATIRASEDRAAARLALQGQAFALTPEQSEQLGIPLPEAGTAPVGFSEAQAEDILSMELARLTRLSRTGMEEDLGKLREEIAELQAILADDTKLRQVIKDELAEVREDFATPRRSRVVTDPGELDIEDLIDDDERVITLSARGYIKSVLAEQFRTQGRGGRGVTGARLRDEDFVVHVLHTTAHAYLLFFSNRGRVYRLKTHEIPIRDRTAQGMAIVNLLELQPEEKIQAIIDTRDYETHRYLFFATRNGTVKKTLFTEYDSSRRAGLIAIDLRDGDELVRVIPTNGNDEIIMVSLAGQGIRFNEDDVRPMGRGAGGVRGMRLRPGDEVVSCDVVRPDADLLTVTTAGFGKRTDPAAFTLQGRGGQGVRAIRITEARGKVVAAFLVAEEDEIILVASNGVIIRTAVAEVSRQGRDATGVRVMNLTGDDSVASATVVPASTEDGESDGADPADAGDAAADAGGVAGAAGEVAGDAGGATDGDPSGDGAGT